MNAYGKQNKWRRENKGNLSEKVTTRNNHLRSNACKEFVANRWPLLMDSLRSVGCHPCSRNSAPLIR